MSRQFRSDDTIKWKHGFGDGSDGDLTISSSSSEAPIDSSCSGTAGASTLSATNASFAVGQFILIHQSRGTGAGNWELAKIVGYTAGTITLDKPLQNTYTDSGASQAQVRVMKQYNNVTINSSQTYTAKKWDKNVGGILGFFAKGLVTIAGNISATNQGYENGTTQSAGNPGRAAEGTAGDVVIQSNANGNGGGGGTNGSDPNHGAGGGGGGNGAAGSNATASGGTTGKGGAAVGHAELTAMLFGGGGGAGGTGTNGSPRAGGDGGGIVFIIASSITITGTIVTNGQNGVSASGDQAGGGGGAGGSVLLKCKTATLGTNKMTVAAGSGGAGNRGNGGNGGVGRINVDHSGTITGSSTPTFNDRTDNTIKARRGGGALYTNFL